MEATDIKDMDFPKLQETFSGDIPPGGELIDPLPFAADLGDLNKRMDQYAGSSVNPRKVRLSDFEYRFIRYEPPTGVSVFFMHRRSGRTMLSNLDLWERGSHWVICGELGGMDIPRRTATTE